MRLLSLRTATFALAALALVGCELPPATPPGLMDVAERPAEKALLGGMRAYDDGQYAPAEAQLKQALAAGLASPRDRAAARKHLAFIYCTSQRLPACEAEFRAARRDDPAFTLTRAEAGHPLWGPVWLKARN